MKSQILNYRVLIEKELQPDGTEVYVSYVPVLGISDFGNSVDEAMSNTQAAIELYIETLLDHNSQVPSNSNTDYFLGQTMVNVSLLREKANKTS